MPTELHGALGPDQRQTRLAEGQGEVREVPAATFPTLFESQVRRTPGAVALDGSHGERLSYRELDARANRLAHYLIGLGTAPESLVGIALDRSVEMIVAVLATWKAFCRAELPPWVWWALVEAARIAPI